MDDAHKPRAGDAPPFWVAQLNGPPSPVPIPGLVVKLPRGPVFLAFPTPQVHYLQSQNSPQALHNGRSRHAVMKLTIDLLRRLVLSEEATKQNLEVLQCVTVLDLSNGGILGAQIADLLQFISLSNTPLALQSVDVGHNRLGDAGAIALARLVQANASKLTRLASLGLFDNGIRDEGALLLSNAMKGEVEEGNLPSLTSVALHDNDISELVLLKIDALWREIPVTRAIGWLRTQLPSETADADFGALFKRQLETEIANDVTTLCSTGASFFTPQTRSVAQPHEQAQDRQRDQPSFFRCTDRGRDRSCRIYFVKKPMQQSPCHLQDLARDRKRESKGAGGDGGV